MHNPAPGVYNFTGGADLGRFIEIAQSVGLLVLLRPGPYICGAAAITLILLVTRDHLPAEWDFGGFPAWLLNITPPVTLRTYQSGYINAVRCMCTGLASS